MDNAQKSIKKKPASIILKTTADVIGQGGEIFLTRKAIKAVSKVVKDPMGALKNAPPLAKAGLVGATALGTKAAVDSVMGHGKNSNEEFEFANKLIESGLFSEEEIIEIINQDQQGD